MTSTAYPLSKQIHFQQVFAQFVNLNSFYHVLTIIYFNCLRTVTLPPNVTRDPGSGVAGPLAARAVVKFAALSS